MQSPAPPIHPKKFCNKVISKMAIGQTCHNDVFSTYPVKKNTHTKDYYERGPIPRQYFWADNLLCEVDHQEFLLFFLLSFSLLPSFFVLASVDRRRTPSRSLLIFPCCLNSIKSKSDNISGLLDVVCSLIRAINQVFHQNPSEKEFRQQTKKKRFSLFFSFWS